MNPQNSTRKPYVTPRIVVYGDIAEITQNISQMGTADNTPGAKKT
jgi:hypothetical protein